MRTIFVFGFMIMGKELQEDLKFAIFTNWLDTRLEMETPPFGGCFARFLESSHRFGRSKCHFLALEGIKYKVKF